MWILERSRLAWLSFSCCQVFWKGTSMWNLTLVELKSGRNLRGWFDLEDRVTFSCGVASSPSQREKSSVFWSEKESDVEQNHLVLDLRVLYSACWTDQEQASFIWQRRRKNLFWRENSSFGFTSALQDGWDRMLQGQEVSLFVILLNFNFMYQLYTIKISQRTLGGDFNIMFQSHT